MEPGVLDDLQVNEQAICCYEWDSATESSEKRLMRELAYEFARMLRHQLNSLRRPHGEAPPLEQYLEKIQTVVSYSKNDEHGNEIAAAAGPGSTGTARWPASWTSTTFRPACPFTK